MTATVSVLPVWKKDASLPDRLEELANWARANPEHFEKFVVGMMEKLPNGNYKFRVMSYGCSLPEEIGLFEIGKSEAMLRSER